GCAEKRRSSKGREESAFKREAQEVKIYEGLRALRGYLISIHPATNFLKLSPIIQLPNSY
ncbi:MAG: hypothetical protein Q8K77_05550, partial [Thermodesulfovibrionales bacterium]|nr:hypothetical protein [Thermodesulfovibrionales bacterium]